MNLPHRSLLATACLAVLCISSPASAAVLTFTDETAFLSAMSLSGTDSFDDIDTETPNSPFARNAGPFTYEAMATGDGLYTLQLGGDVWLSTAAPQDVLSMSGFSPSAQGAGGYFFATDLPGELLPGFAIELVYAFAGETVSYTLTPQSSGEFFGVLGDSPLLQLTIRNLSGAESPQFVTVNDFTVLGTDVPEPGTWALISAGLAILAGRRHLRSV